MLKQEQPTLKQNYSTSKLKVDAEVAAQAKLDAMPKRNQLRMPKRAEGCSEQIAAMPKRKISAEVAAKAKLVADTKQKQMQMPPSAVSCIPKAEAKKRSYSRIKISKDDNVRAMDNIADSFDAESRDKWS
jgi:hypothetical protein